MRCDEVQPLRDAYLDSELDARTALEIERHLGACADCARRFAEEQGLEAQIKATLNQGPRTAGLWEQIERAVAGAAPVTTPARPLPRVSQPAGWSATFQAIEEKVRAAWRRSPTAWAGLAAAWVVILGLNLTAREPGPAVAARHQAPSPSELRLALKQRQMLMADLALGVEPAPAPAEKPKAVGPRPRSERRGETVNV